jgi:hypothetical protein
MTSGSVIINRVSEMHVLMTAEPLNVHGSPTTLYAAVAMADRTGTGHAGANGPGNA